MRAYQSLTAKIFVRYFQKGWFILIAIGLLLNLTSGKLVFLGAMMVNISATFIFFKLSVIIHEAGHLLGAKVTGGEPKRMVLGMGHETFRTEIKGLKIIMNSIPLGGMAMATFTTEKNLKWRYALYFAGGVLLNGIVAAIFFFIFGFEPGYLTGERGIDLATPMIIANAVKIINLIPFSTSAYGMPMPTDGMVLLKIPFYSKEDLSRIELKNQYYDAYEFFEKHEYETALSIYKHLHQHQPNEPTALLNISAIHLRRGELDKALDALAELEEKVASKKVSQLNGLLFNNLAWLHLVKNDIDKAHRYAIMAKKAIPKSNAVLGTYGCILIECGELLEGMQYLFKNMDFEHPNNNTLSASIYLMLAYHLRNDHSSSNKHFQFVNANMDKLSVDEKILFDRNCEKISGLQMSQCQPISIVIPNPFQYI